MNNPQASTVDLLVIGAGISGLSCAHYGLRAGWTVRVLERDTRVGGCLHSHRFEGALKGFWLELGAHSAFNSYGRFLDILGHYGLIERLLPREKVPFRLLVAGQVRPIGSQVHWGEALRVPFRWWFQRHLRRREGLATSAYFSALIGHNNYVNVLEPSLNAVLSQPAGNFPADALFRPRARRKDIARSFTLPSGLQTAAETIAQDPALSLWRGCTVQSLTQAPDGYLVHTDQGTHRARAVVIATPMDVARQLLHTVHPVAARHVEGMGMASIETLGVATHHSRFAVAPTAGLIARDEPFYSAVSRDTVHDHRCRGFAVHFRPGALNLSEQRQRVSQVLGLPEAVLHDPDLTVSCTRALPALRVGDAQRLAALDQALAGHSVALTGNYFTGVAIEDCIGRSWEVFQKLSQDGFRLSLE